MNKFIMTIAMAIVAIGAGFVVLSLYHDVRWGLLTAAVVFVGYIIFAVYQGKRIKALKVK